MTFILGSVLKGLEDVIFHLGIEWEVLLDFNKRVCVSAVGIRLHVSTLLTIYFQSKKYENRFRFTLVGEQLLVFVGPRIT